MITLQYRANSVPWLVKSFMGRLWCIALAALLGTTMALNPSDTSATSGLALTIGSVDASAFPSVTARVSVVDGLGRSVHGYTADDFEVTESGQRAKQITVTPTFDAAEPLAVVVLVDVSGKHDEATWTATRAAALRFFEGLGEPGPASLIAFSNEARVVKEFTGDRVSLSTALNALQPNGNTALYDALFAAVDYGTRSGIKRTLVAVITDGNDTSSKAALDDGINLARQKGIPIYTIGVGSWVNRQILARTAEATGAAAYFNPSSAELDKAYRSLSEGLRSEYLVKYQSPAPKGSVSYRLGVKVGRLFSQASAETNFAVNLQRPRITELSLSDGTVVEEPMSFGVVAEGVRPIVAVHFDANGQRVAEQNTPPYTFELDPYALAAGRHQVSVTAIDEAGNSITSRIGVTVPTGLSRPDAPPPTKPAPSSGLSLPALPDLSFPALPGLSLPALPELDPGRLYAVVAARSFALIDNVALVLRAMVVEYGRAIGFIGLMVAAFALGVVELAKTVEVMRRRLVWVLCPECQMRYRAYEDSCPHCWLERSLAQYADRSLATLLVENRLLNAEEMEACLAQSAESNKPLELTLVETRRLTGDQLRQAMFYYNRSAEMAERRRELLASRVNKGLWDMRALTPRLVLALIAFSISGISLPNILG